MAAPSPCIEYAAADGATADLALALFETAAVVVAGVAAAGVVLVVVESTVSVVPAVTVVVASSVEDAVVVEDSALGVVPVTVLVLVAAGTRADPTDRTVTEDPPLESEVEVLPVERARADPPEPVVRLGPEDWLELLPELLAECDVDPLSDDPPSVDAAATPCPTPTARPRPMAAAKRLFWAARLPF